MAADPALPAAGFGPAADETDSRAAPERTDRDAPIHAVERIHVEEGKRRDMREQLRRGYRAMARINRVLAEEGPIFERIGGLP